MGGDPSSRFVDFVVGQPKTFFRDLTVQLAFVCQAQWH